MDYIVNFFKMFVVCNLTFYIYFRIIDSKDISVQKVIFNILTCVLVAIVYVMIYLNLNSLTAVIFSVLIQGTLFSFYVGKKVYMIN